MLQFLVIAMPVGGLASNGTRSSAGRAMTSFASCICMGPARGGLRWGQYIVQKCPDSRVAQPNITVNLNTSMSSYQYMVFPYKDKTISQVLFSL